MGTLVGEFLPISQSDCEAFRTVALLSRMTERIETLRETLRKETEKTGAVNSSKLMFGLFNLVANNASDVLESKTNVEDALDMFEQIIEEQPNYWLAKMYKIRIQLMLPSSFRDEDEVIEEIMDMIEQQKKGEFRPYYVIPYLLISGLYWSFGESEKAREFISEAKKLEASPITVISDFLILIFDDLETKLRSSGEHESANDVLELKNKYFQK